MNYNSKQRALLEFEITRELSELTGLTPEEVLDIVFPMWRDIREHDYGERITWGQALALKDELDKVKKGLKKGREA